MMESWIPVLSLVVLAAAAAAPPELEVRAELELCREAEGADHATIWPLGLGEGVDVALSASSSFSSFLPQ